MPSLQTARRVANAKNNGAKTIGQIYKEQSDFLMEETWESDVASKLCYIYDFFHDDQPDKNVGMTYENTTKTRIDAKILVSTYGSLAKDQPELQCMFKPSQKEYFDETDELFYMEEYRRKYGIEDIFVGMYLDVPDKKGVYHKHLICLKDIEQNFQKYFILPCGYKLQFIRKDEDKRIKQEIWCVLRSQSSYNNGLWVDRYFTVTENQEIIFLPTNTISDNISYISKDNESNQRMIIDIPNYGDKNWTPNAFKVSKIERANTKGRTKVTLAQSTFDQHSDYIEKDNDGNIIGLWADFYSSNIEPTDPDTPSPTPSSIHGKITASTSTIKVGGSYKTLTLKLYDANNNEVTDNYSSSTFDWTCYIKGNETDDLSDKVTWLNGSLFNQKKIKFSDDRSYLNQILVIKCVVDGIETVEEFELIGT